MKLQDHQLDYILRRALGLCLTDAKAPVDEPMELLFSESLSQRRNGDIVFVPLTVLLGIGRLVQIVRSKVAMELDRIERATGSSRSIDFTATAEAMLKGRPVVLRPSRRRVSHTRELGAASWLVAESIALAHIVNEEFHSFDGVEDANGIQNILSRLDQELEELRRLQERIKAACPAEVDTVTIHDAAIAQAAPHFRDFVATSPLEEEAFDHQIQYLSATRPAAELVCRSSTHLRPVLAERERLLGLSVGLGRGSRYRYAQSRSHEHLYELWCFAEVSRSMFERWGRLLIQKSLLRASSSEALLSAGGGAEVYFDYYGNATEQHAPDLIFEGDHVEWFIAGIGPNRRGMVIDTKCKLLRADDRQKIVYYMAQFNADAGTVFTAMPLAALRSFRDSHATRRFALSSWDGRPIGIVALVPDPEEEQANTHTLGVYLDRVVQPLCEAAGIRLPT